MDTQHFILQQIYYSVDLKIFWKIEYACRQNKQECKRHEKIKYRDIEVVQEEKAHPKGIYLWKNFMNVWKIIQKDQRKI